MSDPINPIAAEFGETEGIPVVPIKPEKEIDPSDGFQREMEKKSRTVQGKEEEQQARQDYRQLEHEIIVNKPSVDEAVAARSSQNSILDIQKTSTDKNTPKEASPLDPTAKTAKTTSATGAEADLSQGHDSFGKNLASATPSSGKKKEEVELVGPSVSSVAPEEGKKKVELATDMQASTGHKDPSSQEKTITAAPQKQKQTEQAQPAITTTAAPKTSQPVEKTPVQEQVLPASKQAAQVVPQTTKAEGAPATQNLAHQVPQTEKKIAAPASAQTAFGQTSQDQKKPEGQIHLESLETVSPEQTEKLTATTAHLFAVAPPSEIRKETWVSKEEQEKAAGHAKVEAASQSEAADQEQKERDRQEEEKEKHALTQSSQNLLNQLFPDLAASAPPEAIGFDRLPPHILDLFDRLVGVITVMQMQGKTETTLYLNEQQSPLLKNTAVTITSYSTAPMAYNIEFKAPPETSSILQKHVDQLKRSFKDPKKEFNFQIHEIMISLQEEKEST